MVSILTITYTLAGLVSAAISITLLLSILRSNVRLQIPYRRLVFGISLGDLVLALAFLFSSFAMPSNMYPDLYAAEVAIGNQITCSIQGSLSLYGVFVSIMYTCSLAIYFLCTIKHRMKFTDFQKKYELYLHVTSIVLPMILIGSFNAFDAINPWAGICTLASYPDYCSRAGMDDVVCERGANASIFWIICDIILGITGITIGVIFVSIACAVVKLEAANKKYTNGMSQWRQRLNRPTDTPGTPISQNQTMSNSTDDIPLRRQRQQKQRRQSIRVLQSRRRENAIKIQAFFYLFGFMITIIFPVLNTLFHQLGYEDNMILLMGTAIFTPLKGLINIVTYTFPHVLSLKRSQQTQQTQQNNDNRNTNVISNNANTDTSLSWWSAFWKTIFSGGDHDQMEIWTETRRQRLRRRSSARGLTSANTQTAIQLMRSKLDDIDDIDNIDIDVPDNDTNEIDANEGNNDDNDV